MSKFFSIKTYYFEQFGKYFLLKNKLLAAVNFRTMKVKDLIEELQKQDPDKEVMIEQGEQCDYMVAYTVKEKDLVDMIEVVDDGIIQAVVIEYS